MAERTDQQRTRHGSQPDARLHAILQSSMARRTGRAGRHQPAPQPERRARGAARERRCASAPRTRASPSRAPLGASAKASAGSLRLRSARRVGDDRQAELAAAGAASARRVSRTSRRTSGPAARRDARHRGADLFDARLARPGERAPSHGSITRATCSATGTGSASTLGRPARGARRPRATLASGGKGTEKRRKSDAPPSPRAQRRRPRVATGRPRRAHVADVHRVEEQPARGRDGRHGAPWRRTAPRRTRLAPPQSPSGAHMRGGGMQAGARQRGHDAGQRRASRARRAARCTMHRAASRRRYASVLCLGVAMDDAPLLRVRDLVTSFRTDAGVAPRGRRRVVRRPARDHGRPGRRERLRQERDGALDPAPRRVPARAHRVRHRRARGARPPRAPRARDARGARQRRSR